METRLTANSRLGVHLVDDMVEAVVSTVADDMRGQRAAFVYEVLTAIMSRRLPGIDVDDEMLRTAAARISVGLAPCA